MKLIKVLILFLIFSSCSTNNNPVKTGYTLDYSELDSFLKDSLPKTLDLYINKLVLSLFKIWLTKLAKMEISVLFF